METIAGQQSNSDQRELLLIFPVKGEWRSGQLMLNFLVETERFCKSKY